MPDTETSDAYESNYVKYDAHFHPLGPKKPCVELMDAAKLGKVQVLSYSDFRTSEALEELETQFYEDVNDYPARMVYSSSFSLHGFEEPGYVQRTIAKLESDFERRGAVGVKVWKDLGMMLKDAQGRYVFCDDERFRPIFDYLADRNAVITMHLADPKAAWLPLDPKSPHYRYYSNHPEFHWCGRTDVPSHDELIARRDALVARYPYVRFVCCHLGSLEHDVDEVGAFLHRYPNAYVDTAARHNDFTLQDPAKVKAFFERYSHRILYGSDWELTPADFSADPAERAAFIAKRVNHFNGLLRYYEETLALSRDVLEHFYHRNAERILKHPRRYAENAQ
ncbi:MAG: amidohydrolase family protein [FCB group bacterium]|jgi:predicted TIM-barrel fold metal-dependent hydrolase|nr:amidohydrolase family protein [FCB group bacterium]